MMTELSNSPSVSEASESPSNYKPFLTLDQQVKLLRDRDLAIHNEQFAKDTLEDSSYYRFSGYSLTLRKDDHFFPGVTFEDVTDIYNFDQALRSLLFQYLHIIEVRIKSVYAYEFAKMYGPKGYTDPTKFKHTKASDIKSILKNIENMRKRGYHDELFLRHYKNEQLLPIWVLIELFTFGNLSRIYQRSKDELKIAVAVELRKDHKKIKNISYFGKNLRCLNTLRNFCAHGSRLFNRVFYRKPALSSKESKLLNYSESSQLYGFKQSAPDNSHLYGFILVMKSLLRDNDFDALKSSIIALEARYPKIDMGYYGFPKGWESTI